MVNPKRIRILKEGSLTGGPVAYWMSRDQRVSDNWALVYAQRQAIMMQKPLVVVFCLLDNFLHATKKQYAFMIKGLMEVEDSLSQMHIPFFVLFGLPEIEMSRFVETFNISMLFTDFDPLKIKRQWKGAVSEGINIPFFEVDAHNIVPCWVASQKQEYGAYTIRPKIYRLLEEFNEASPELNKHPIPWDKKPHRVNWDSIIKRLGLEAEIKENQRFIPGQKAGLSVLHGFISEKIHRYHIDRNDPNMDGQSNLSPYLHFGHISAQRVMEEINSKVEDREKKKVFFEELIVRRELSDNFCFYNEDYDNFQGFPEWAKKTLDIHRKDLRAYIYDIDILENAETHDALWNACQKEMVKTGKMHGYMRMYWAKKILEWSESPEDAMEKAIYLNNRYELDGRDPNGYTGIAWCIGGVHDRPWREREIFGKIRYMSYNGCKRKFDIKSYIEKIEGL
ncbi:MAG TPA: deoxyribodipyrimidine photo-lyase [Syntrophorhabdaceae bacterium]|nr:deoxyribodipyrimidine photo-lyase [Syntrophorhabdaceae bacterium]HOL06493.1 deoxyribodipyrimidine photo-lyase [Syntrophorhabdaceae bacterium]HON86423.1 deoxyribodipyrimidine photo-lyase [Syntrophorhabdaceae bacterium]HOT42978.1 deoxyribodipyrimidine photo-lyase [Syntrophorhabdaceae bacterium]HPP42805.1 deoxyribodipyrimidine photo-lyase [Syntrophorhabdaceae bacterium]